MRPPEFQRTMQDSAIRNIFRIFDEDESGRVTKSEIIRVLGQQCEQQKNLQETFPNLEMTKVLAALDKDGDGQIDIEEFTRILHRQDGDVEGRRLLRKS